MHSLASMPKSSSQQPPPTEEEALRNSGFNFLDQIKKSGRSTSSSSSSKAKKPQPPSVEDVSILSANSEGKRLEAAGATPSLKKTMHRAGSAPLAANFTGLTESMSDEGSSGFDMSRGIDAALFRDRYPFPNSSAATRGGAGNESEVEIQFQSDGDLDSSEEDQTWTAPFTAAARAVEKHQQQHHHVQNEYAFENESMVEIEKIWKESGYESLTNNRLSTPEKRRLLQMMPPPPPPPTAHPAPQYGPNVPMLTASEEQSLIQIASSPTASSDTSSEGGRSNHALLDEDETTLAGGDDDNTLNGDEGTYDGYDDSLDDGDTYGDETITLDEYDEDGEGTLAGETLFDDDCTYQEGRRGSVGFLETVLEDLVNMEQQVEEKLGSFLLPGCVAAAISSSNKGGGAVDDDDDDDNTYVAAEATKERIGTWVGFGTNILMKDDETIDGPSSMAPTETLEAINTEEWSLLSRLKQGLYINDDEAAPAKAPDNENQHHSFFDPFFSCRW